MRPRRFRFCDGATTNYWKFDAECRWMFSEVFWEYLAIEQGPATDSRGLPIMDLVSIRRRRVGLDANLIQTDSVIVQRVRTRVAATITERSAVWHRCRSDPPQ